MTRALFVCAAIGSAAILSTCAWAASPKSAANHAAIKRFNAPTGIVYANGRGAISTQEPNDAVAYLKARGDAEMDALRRLVMRIDHVRIDSRTSSSNFDSAFASNSTKAELASILSGVDVVSEREIPIGRNMLVEVTVAVPVYGPAGAASIFPPRRFAKADVLPYRASTPRIQSRAPEFVVPAPRIEARVQVSDLEPTPVEPARRYRVVQTQVVKRCPPRVVAGDCVTGLIVDTRGLRVDRAMAPKLRRSDGAILWGNDPIDLDYLIENGLVTYAHSRSEALRDSRAGGNPLMVRAIGRAGGPFNSDAVLADHDARTIQHLNEKSRFLDSCRVVFIVDEGH